MNTALSELAQQLNQIAQINEKNHENLDRMIEENLRISKMRAELVERFHSKFISQTKEPSCKIVQFVPESTGSETVVSGNPIRINFADYQFKKTF